MWFDRPSATPFALLGSLCVVAGGLVSAATAPEPSEHGSWAAAYLVLVAGVAQIALGAGQARLAPHTPTPRLIAAQFALWNGGNAAVLAGTLAGIVPLVDAGGAALVAALALLVHGVRGARESGAGGGWALRGFRLLVVVLLVSIPIGLVLARIRGA